MSEKIQASTKKEKYRTAVKTQNHLFVVDEPIEVGGKDLGPTPGQLFASSLATCSSITLKMYADHKGWDLQEVIIDVDFERNKMESKTFVTKQIQLIGNLDDEQKKRLLEIASKCPIHWIMSHPIEIKTELTN